MFFNPLKLSGDYMYLPSVTFKIIPTANKVHVCVCVCFMGIS